jgi:outer membrane protein assembly factor BamB
MWTTLIAVALAAAWAGWLASGSTRRLDARVPGTDRADVPVQTRVMPQGQLTQGPGAAAQLEGSWPCFRGPRRDGVAHSDVPLRRQWPQDGPPVLWAIDVGEGYAGAAIHRGRVYLLDYDREQQTDALRCLSFDDGREIWRYSYPVKVKRNHGMSRTVPAVTDRYVVTLGPKCHVLCVDTVSGEKRWMMDLVTEWGATVPPWYAAQCVLIDDGLAILAPGGSALLIAVDCETGDVKWQTPNPRGWKMTHASIVPMEVDGHRMYVYCADRGVVAVSADDGRLLWETDQWRIDIATVPSPVVIGDGRLFLSGGYNAGSMMLRVRRDGDGFTAEVLYRLEPTVFGATQHTPILTSGRLLGVRPDGQLACLSLDGRELWTSGPTARFGLGPFMLVNDLLFVMNDSGLLTLADSAASQYEPLAEAQVLTGHEAWGPMAFADGRLIVRDLTRMVCLDVSNR